MIEITIVFFDELTAGVLPRPAGRREDGNRENGSATGHLGMHRQAGYI
jgi:hypothetical protein